MSTVSLQKGGSVNLSKTNQTISLQKGGDGNLNSIHVGLGWDVHNDVNADLDAFIVQQDSNGNILDTIYYGNKTSNDRAVVHQGDNLTGAGEGDDEVIKIDLTKLNPNTHRLYVAVNIYQSRITFDKIENAFIRILNNQTNDVLMQYNLSKESGSNYAMIMGVLEKNSDGTWSFNALGLATKDGSVQKVVDRIKRGLSNSGSDSNNSAPQEEGKGLLGRLFGR